MRKCWKLAKRDAFPCRNVAKCQQSDASTVGWHFAFPIWSDSGLSWPLNTEKGPFRCMLRSNRNGLSVEKTLSPTLMKPNDHYIKSPPKTCPLNVAQLFFRVILKCKPCVLWLLPMFPFQKVYYGKRVLLSWTLCFGTTGFIWPRLLGLWTIPCPSCSNFVDLLIIEFPMNEQFDNLETDETFPN